ncbi:nuclear pore complex protein [Holotrichia oblita]|uniref:Nuclear pore complex protein n=1 Tax=Holotrichia oblita TaxID=644536 RepID=A0ACB9T3I2_HOLOL|nr:nuclear pore complex protein [Holotrichia oblita]
MAEYNFGYREVIPDQTLIEKWKEITLNTGGRQSTLQDIKVAERSNGYCYRDSSKPHTRNRFIYWRIIHDILEIIEQSLDITLAGNALRYRFVDTPILDGISIHETCTSVIVLVPTVCSIHRLVFPHPDRLHRQDELLGTHPELVVPSIFSEASVAQAKNPATFHIITNPVSAGSQLPHCAASWFTWSDEEAYFILSYLSGDVLLIKQLQNGACDSIELKFESIVPRFLHGLAEKFRSKGSDGNVIVSVVLHTVGLETYALTLCKNGHLRIWSCTKYQCIAVSDILTETLSNNSLQGAQNHVLKKAVGDNETDFILGVVLNFISECQFHILKPIINGNQFRLIKLNTLYSPGVDLVDFSLTTARIWSVWRGEDGECSVYSAALSHGGERGSHWIPVVLESLPHPSEVPNNPDLDPKQLYLEYIFYPGRFSLNIISKALSIYKKSAAIADINLSIGVLKQRVCMAVENEIQAELQECEVSDDEYLDCATWCWSRFYSCCVQYHVSGLRPLGVLLLPAVSGAVLLKKCTYSFLRPLDVLEHLFLCSNYLTRDHFTSHPQLGVSFEETDDLIELTSVLVHVDTQLSDLFKQTFDNELRQLKSPDTIMANLVDEVMTGMSEEFSYYVVPKLSNCRDVYNALHRLLELLRLEQCVEDIEKIPAELQVSIDHLFSSQLGISFASQCLKQQLQTRFTISRNLLALQTIILKIKKENWNFVEAVRSVCIPETVVLIQAYKVMTWLSDLTAQSTVTSEATMQKLSPLKLAPVFNLKINLNGMSLMDLFIGSVGGFEAHKMMFKRELDEDSLPHWDVALLQYLDKLMLLLWPVNGNTIFAEWLLCSGQHIWLQQYVRYLHTWCEWDHLSRNFLLAASFLTSGEFQKAYDLFLKAAKGVYSEQFLIERISISNFIGENANHCILYFFKVIQLFELHGALNYAILVADTALTITEEDDPLKVSVLTGSVMYEQAFRLSQYGTIEALEKQVKCYLASVNAFSLCDPKYAWVLKPVDADVEEEVIQLPCEAGSEMEPEIVKFKRQLEVVELDVIKKELALAIGRLKLAKFDKKLVTNFMTSPMELIRYLACSGIYKYALNLCTIFDVPYESVFETFIQNCLHVTDRDEIITWNWLVENDLHDMPIIGNSAVEVVWQLLQTLLFQYEEEHMTVLHRVVCEKNASFSALSSELIKKQKKEIRKRKNMKEGTKHKQNVKPRGGCNEGEGGRNDLTTNRSRENEKGRTMTK